jgi:hypothetical protein
MLLGCYPRQWRANGRGDELLAVLLDAAEAAGRVRPSALDCLDVGIHGLAERLRAARVVVPDGVRLRISQVSVVLGSALTIFLTMFGELRIPGLSDGAPPYHLDAFLREDLGPFLTVGMPVYATWVLVLATYLFGAVRGCRELALIAVGLTFFAPLLAVLTHHQRPPGGLLATLALLGLGAAAAPAALIPTPRRRLVTAVAVVALTAVLIGWRLWSIREVPAALSRSWLSSRPMFYWNPNGTHLQINRALAGPATGLLVAAAVAALIVWPKRPAWLPVVAFVSVAVPCLRLGTTTFSAPHARLDALAWACAAVGLIAVNYVVGARWLRVRSRRRVRRRSGIASYRSAARGTLGITARPNL